MMSVWQRTAATADKYNEPGQLHHDDRLRVDADAGRQQPAPQRAVPRRQGQGRPGIPVLVLAERGPGEALGVDGARTSRRPAAGCSRFRTTATCRTAACSSCVDFAGKPLTKDYAERRARWERLQEIVQTKGNSESAPDAVARTTSSLDFGIAGWEYGNLTLDGKPLTRGDDADQLPARRTACAASSTRRSSA